ncbi:DUF2794 domain-containing protein [Kordiimonas laminariae]|uniref:DUF2794 domain-containing protein n=1 Tax=Kordiimonas laminariae TaxID=2917717 RepID=UPI001FF44B65|nr:DUF2794 domain-containing protein [Kordiimonas laminariae]MCK0071179.1 DUF2794 domain-containing protein [Kordiimonas laminariae]
MDETSASFHPAFEQSHSSIKKPSKTVYFMRQELNQILNVYGKMVAACEWHDYAIDHLDDMAIFSIHRRASEMPLYRIIKEPALAGKQGMWRILGMNNQILKRGKDLKTMLKYFDRQLFKSVN